MGHQGAGGGLLSLTLFDVYRGAGVPEGSRSLAYALRLQSMDRTLTDTDVAQARDKVIAAVTKLGALQEGILRQDRITWTGRIRDTVIFSVLKDEWPGVRDGLDARLAAFA